MAVNDVTPIERGGKEATFTALAKDFGFDDKVRDLFITGQMENLEDFRYYFSEEKEIDAFVAVEGAVKGAEQRLQIARVRRAWAAVRRNGLRKECRNAVSSVAEMDNMLEEGTLRDVKVQFWKRYKMKYPVEVTPSDQLLSRCYREMEKRLLTVYDVWKVKSLMHQVMTTKKRKQVGTDLYTFEDDADAATEIRGVEKYLSMLHTYLLALSIAGSNKVQGAPMDETLGSDSTKYAKVPWDVLQAYHFRASRSAMLIPEASRLAWLESKDIAERAQWVSQFREGDESLGQVGHAIMEKRDALWEALQSATGSPTFPPQPPLVRDPKKPWQQQQQQQKPRQANFPRGWCLEEFHKRIPGGTAAPQTNVRKMVPGTTAEALRNGKKLCPYFNKGKCQRKGPSCSRGLHKCAKVLRRGWPCGKYFHGAHKCRVP